MFAICFRLKTFKFIKAVYNTVFDMTNAVYRDRPDMYIFGQERAIQQ